MAVRAYSRVPFPTLDIDVISSIQLHEIEKLDLNPEEIPSDSDLEPISDQLSPVEMAEYDERIDFINHATAQLARKEAMAIALARRIDGSPILAIASTLEISAEKAKHVHARAMRRIRALAKKHGLLA